MKILVILPRIPFPPHDGGAITMWQTLLRLRQMGHYVCVVAINASRHPVDPQILHEISDKFYAVDVDTRIRPLSALRSLLIPSEPVRTSLPRTSYWLERFIDKKVFETVAEILQHESYDILQCESLFTLWYGVALREKLGDLVPPTVLHSHNVEYRIMESLAREASRPWYERLYRGHLAHITRRFEEEICRRIDGATVVSHEEVMWFWKHAPGVPVESIPPGVTLEDMDVAVECQPHSIGILGSLEWQPNVTGIVWFVNKVLPLIRQKLPTVTLHIAGRNPVPEIRDLHDGTSVVVHGEVASATMFRRQFAISIVPLFSGSGIRIKILESMGVGRPIVSTTIGAEGLGTTDGVNLLIADDPQAFADSCVELLTNEELYARLTTAAYEFVDKKYSWKTSMNQLVSFYESLIINRRQAPANG